MGQRVRNLIGNRAVDDLYPAADLASNQALNRKLQVVDGRLRAACCLGCDSGMEQAGSASIPTKSAPVRLTGNLHDD